MEEEAVKSVLIEKFGVFNTENLIRHFDQTVSLMIVSVVSRALINDQDDPMMAIKILQPESFTQNLYLNNGVTFRDAATKAMVLNVPVDEEEPIWHLKADVKVISWISDDGFVVENMGCSDSLDGGLYDGKRLQCRFQNYWRITILKIQKGLDEKMVRLEKTAKGADKDLHKEAIQEAMDTIKSFKTGGLAFDQLVDAVKTLAAKSGADNIPHASSYGQLKGKLVAKQTGTENTIG